MRLPVIQTCGECAFCHTSSVCMHPRAHPVYEIDGFAKQPPDWCPLRTGPDAERIAALEAEIERAASDYREIRPSADGDLDAAVDRAQAEGRVLDLPALVRLCMDPQVDTLIYAITEAGAVFLFDETSVRKAVVEMRAAAQAEVLEVAKRVLMNHVGHMPVHAPGVLARIERELEAGRG